MQRWRLACVSCLLAAGVFAIWQTKAIADAPPSSAQPVPSQFEWNRFTMELGRTGERIKGRVDPASRELQANADQTMFMTVAHAALVIAQQDPEYPDWIPYINVSIPLAAPNPDTIYYVARIDGDGIYRISGKRGSVRLVDIQIAKGLWGLVDQPGPTYRNLDLDSFDIEADGSFELILSRERPKDYRGNWAALDTSADHLFVRQVSYDWLREEDARMAIERLDVTQPRPRRTPQRIHDDLEKVPKFVERLMTFWQESFNSKVRRGLINKLEFIGQGTLKSALNSRQAYYQGVFSIGPGEALILETDVPKRCRYWGIQIYDELINSIDYMYHPSSLNGGSAQVDADGNLRVVIANEDPGTPNWIDASGYETGGLLGRWYDCDSEPLPTLKKVAFNNVFRHLPSDTRTVNRDERRIELSERIRGAQLRRRW